MSISIPFNIILKYRGVYLKNLTEFAENLTTNTMTNETNIETKNVIFKTIKIFLEKRNKKQIRKLH